MSGRRFGCFLLGAQIAACTPSTPSSSSSSTPKKDSAVDAATATGDGSVLAASSAIGEAGAAPLSSSSSSPPTCADVADAGGDLIDVWLKKEPRTPRPDLSKADNALAAVVLTIPALKIRQDLDIIDPRLPRYCRMQIFAPAQKAILICAYGGGTTEYEIALDRGKSRLTFESTSKERMTEDLKQTVHPPVLVSCGTRLVFHPFRFRDPKWERYGGVCTSRCFDAEDTCLEPCRNFTDAKGDFTPAGEKCNEACKDAAWKCQQRCPPQ